MLWGFSEALDLHNEYERYIGESPSELNILLYGSGDPRHILKTLSKTFQHNTKVNIFTIEACLEIVARNCLLMNVCFENPDDLSIRGKTHLFLDLYGNSLLRPSSYSYMCSKAVDFLKIITDFDYARQTIPMYDFEQLKYKERDHLEGIFTFWRHSDKHKFDIATHWTDQIRKNLGVRFDSRNGVFDWDLQMKLKDNGASQICSQEYRHWRETGVAFVFPEYEQCMPNKSLAIGILKCGSSYGHRGYVGDITIGPYTTFGLQCGDTKMLESNHGTNKYRATDVSERNVYEMMYEIVEKKPYEHNTSDSHQYGSTGLRLSAHLPTLGSQFDEKNLKKYNKPIISIKNFRIIFLPHEDVLKLNARKEFEGKFDVIFVARNYVPFLKNVDYLRNVLNVKSLVLFETRQYSTMNKSDISENFEQIKLIAKDMGLETVTKFNINCPLPVVRFKRDKKLEPIDVL